MATHLPFRLSTLTQDTTNSTSLLLALRPWHRRILLQQIARWTFWGCIVGLLLANFVLLLAHLFPWASATVWATGVGVACLLFALVAVLRFRPSLARAARIVDRRLRLHDRLGTAWELRDETSSLAQLQRHDALKQLQQYTPAKTLPLRPGGFALPLFAIAALALLLLVVLPNPVNAVLKQQAAFQARVATQIKHIEQLRQELAQQSALSTQQKARADQILRDLEKQLQQAKNATEAQQALAQAQARLDQLRNPQTANKAAARSAAGASLQGNSNANLNAAGQALANNDTKGLANALKSLASQVNKLSAVQRSQLAQQIESAANQAGQDLHLSSALHQLAKSIADGNAGEVADAANAVQAAASQNASTQMQDSSIAQTEQGVQQAANNLAAATDGSNTTAQGQSQQGQQRQGQGQGQQGQRGQGQGGAGGNSGAGKQPGKDDQVYVPGQIGSGSSTQDNNGNTGEVQPGSSEPFSQVIEQYSQVAHDAMNTSDIPPDMKDLVQGYFNNLEGQ